jgi:pectate lyase
MGWAAVSGAVGGATVATTTGGGSTTPTVVTSVADFTSAVSGTSPGVVYVSGNLNGSVGIGSNKTVVGICGATFTGHLDLSRSVNVIVRNLTIVGFNCKDADAVAAGQCSSGADAVTIVNDAHHIWFDHDDISDGSDGNLDTTEGSDFVTISWTKFHYSSLRADLPGGSDSTGAEGHRFSNLIGAADGLPIDVGHLNITFHHDWWADNVNQRMPRTRAGKIHVLNNLYTATGDSYCIGIGVGANVRNEGNAFIDVKAPLNETFMDSTSIVTSINDLYTGVAAAGPNLGTAFTPPYAFTVDDPSTVQAEVMAGAGPH